MCEKKYDESQDCKPCFWKRIIIKRQDGTEYLKRLTVIRCFLGSIMVHNILQTDNGCLHDHPWSFLSIILKGGYVEHTKTGARLYGPGSILYRPAKFSHRLEIFQPCKTIVITGPKRRTWGFWTPKGWKKWTHYSSQNKCE